MLDLSRRQCLAGILSAGIGGGSAWAGEAPPAVAARIATTEWAGAETMLAVGAKPLVTASPFRMQSAVTDGLADVAKIGSLFAPNLEALQLLAPDLIICAAWQAGIIPQLQRICPLFRFDLREASHSIIENSLTLVRDIGTLTDSREKADFYIVTFGRRIEELREEVSRTAFRKILVGSLEPDGRHVTVFGERSLFHEIMTKLGLENAWQGPVSPWGSTLQGVEVLAHYPDTPFIGFDNGPGTAIALASLSSSTLWNRLPSVRQGLVIPIPFAWLLGGAPTGLSFAESVVAALREKEGAPSNG